MVAQTNAAFPKPPVEQQRIPVYTMEDLAERYAEERFKPQAAPLRLGFGSIDARLRGISSGQVCAVCARTGVGKTFFLCAAVQNLSANREAGLLILSLEQPGLEWFERQLAIFAGVATEQVEAWARQRELAPQMEEFCERMAHVRLIEDPVSLEAVPGALAACRNLLSVPLRGLLIDYSGLLRVRGQGAYERASAIAVGLKLLAKQQQVAILVAMQLSRAGGDGSLPVSLDMLRDSGVLEESADFILGCWQPGKARELDVEQRAELRDSMTVRILKNRKGEEGHEATLRFDPASRRLFEPADPFEAFKDPFV